MAGSNIYFKGKWKKQIFTTSGQFNVPHNTNQVFVEMYGGGGGGGRQDNNGDNIAYGGGAGERVFAAVTVSPNTSITVTIGAGGSGAYIPFPSFVAATDGGDTFFGALRARGGKGGSGTLVNGAYVKTHKLGTGDVGEYAAGGASILDGSGTFVPNGFGGDGAYGKGGDASDSQIVNAENGGIGAGGGALTANNTAGTRAGDGGPGICIVYYKSE